MPQRLTPALAALALASGALPAQEVKVDVLLVAWVTQMMDANLRLNGPPTAPAGLPARLSYYGLGGTTGSGTVNPYSENGVSLRRTELYLAVKLSDGLSANVMVDPNQPTPNLYDAYLTWKPLAGLDVRLGQFKPFGYESSCIAAPDLLFTDRAQVVRAMTDVRDRGVMATWAFGDKALGGRLGLGVFNGASDRQNDANAQKDVVLRGDFTAGPALRFGAYVQQGTTSKADRTGPGTQGAAFGAASPTNRAPTPDAFYHDKDRTTTAGIYYAFTQGPWHVDGEAATGRLGRRFPAFNVGTAAAARQHLDQAFLGYYLTGGYTTGHHRFRLRYDLLDYNRGNRWYTTFNPYKDAAPGVARADGGDYTPRYTEITAGYTYAFNPELVRKANLKCDYIRRSRNFLAPREGQSGAQGGDSLVVAYQVWY